MMKEIDLENDGILNDVWTLYFHDPYDEDWTLSSYQKLIDVSSVEDFWNVQNALKNKIHLGMFFLMREYVFPCWDDENNRNGGCLSIKVLKQDVDVFWEEMSMLLLGETLLVPEKRTFWDNVNGISTSPKKHFCIVKIWLKSEEIADEKYFSFPQKIHGNVLYKSNKETILGNVIKSKV